MRSLAPPRCGVNGTSYSSRTSTGSVPRRNNLPGSEAWQTRSGDVRRIRLGRCARGAAARRVADREWIDFTHHAARGYSGDETLRSQAIASGLMAVGLAFTVRKALQLRHRARVD